MSSVLDNWKAQLDQLPPNDRAELAYYLLSSLDDDEDEGDETAWDAEASRRVNEIRAGTATGRDADALLGELRALSVKPLLIHLECRLRPPGAEAGRLVGKTALTPKDIEADKPRARSPQSLLPSRAPFRYPRVRESDTRDREVPTR